jgi:uncharacterized protein YjbI with pentapeptide repeats
LSNKRQYVSPLPRKESPQRKLELGSQDLDAIRKSVEDAATVGAGLWLSYLFLTFYFAVAAGAITHVDLLLENAVKLPFLNIELPLIGFFSVAPVLFIVVHSYTLVHFVLLGRKASSFDERLYSLFPNTTDGNVRNKVVREGLRAQLPSNVFVQLLAGPAAVRESGFGMLLRIMSFCTLAVAPILVLSLFQVQFLPYHDAYVTWVSRISILIDVLLLWWLWPKISRRHPTTNGGNLARKSFSAAAGLSSLLVLIFSWGIATFPGERIHALLPSVDTVPTKWSPLSLSTVSSRESIGRWIEGLSVVSAHKLLFAGSIDEITRRRSSLFSNTLVVANFDIYSALKIDDPAKIRWKDSILTLRGRHLEGAVFDNAKLFQADLSNAFLESASFTGASMPGVDLSNARLDGASFHATDLQGANLTGAKLRGASLILAHLEGASLQSASLIGAVVVESNFSGANLDNADFQGAQDALVDNDNVGPNFTGASLKKTNLQGMFLINANFSAADLSGAFFWRRVIEGSRFDATLCSDVVLGATIANAEGEQMPWTAGTLKNLITETEADSRFEETKVSVRQSLRILDCERTDQDPAIFPPCGEKAAESKVTKAYAEAFRKSCFPKGKDHDRIVLAALRKLVCTGSDRSIYVLRSLLKNRDVLFGRDFDPPSQQAAEFMSFVLSKSCPVSTVLSDADKGELAHLRNRASSERKQPSTR